MTAEQLRNSILQEAISGRLVPQDPDDEPAAVLLQCIREEKAQLVKEGKLKKKDLVETPITAEEIPFEIPASWEWCHVADILQINPKNKIDDNVDAAFIPMEKIKATYLSEFTYATKKWKDIKNGFTHFADGDIAFAKITPCFQNRKSMILRDLPNGIGAGTTELKVLRPYCDTIDAYYLLFFLESAYFVEQAVFKGTANQQRIITGYLENKLFPLPPLAEQKRIVAKLEELLPIVEQYGKAQKELDELNAALPARLRQSILQEAISGRLVPQDENETADGLVKLILDRKKALLKSGELERRYVKELPIDDSEFEIELPKGWCLCKLGNIARISAGGTPARGVAAYWSNGKIPWLKISDITASDKYVNSASEYITEAGMNNSSAKLMKKGTLLYTIFASIGEVGILNFEATCNQAIANIDLYVPEMTNYIYYYLKNLQAYMYSISKGCAQLNINQDILKNAIVPLPPLTEQQRIVAKIEELFEQIDKLK